MIKFEKNNYIYKLYKWLPILALYISVLNEFDFNYLNIDYFSFNFPFILIFYFALKEYNKFDHLLVFLAGLINDTVVGLPLGISSFSYIVVCIFASYLRNITIRPHLIKDWFYFLFVISLINSINYSILFLFFSYDLNILFYVSVVHSDWKYAVTHHSGVVYWYYEESLVKSGDWRKILIKSRYPESSIMKLKHNVGSAKGLYKINCSEFSYQFMEQ